MQKVQGSVSGRKIKRNTSSAVWNTERKYNSTPHSYLHHPYRNSTADIGIADEETFRLIRSHLSVASCLLTLGEVGEVRGIFKCNYSKQFGKLLSYDRHRFRLCSCLNHQEAHERPTLTTMTFEVDKSVRGMTSQDESCTKTVGAEVCRNTPRDGEGARETANAWKLLFTSQGLRGSSGDVLLEQHICRPTHYSRIHSGLTHAQDRLQISPTNSLDYLSALFSYVIHKHLFYFYTSLSI